MNQISKDGIAQSDLDQDATTQEHLKFQMSYNRMCSPTSCLFWERFSLEFRLLRTPMKEDAVCIILWFSTSEYVNWKLILNVHFKKSILSRLLTSEGWKLSYLI